MIKVTLARILLFTLGILGVANTLTISRISSNNLGVLMPAILGAPLILCGIFWHLMDKGVGRVIRIVFFMCYALFFAALSITWIIIDTHAAKAHPENSDIIIVLGAGLRGETPTLVLKKRLDKAIEYLVAYPDSVAILSGGKGSGEHISEAEAMERYLSNRGIDESRYIKEDRSTNTRENFRFSNEIIKERFGRDVRVAFVTTNFHVYRAGLTAKRQGMEVVGIAAPDSWYLSVNNHLRECVAIWAYAVLGG